MCDRAGVKAPTLYHHFGDLGRLQQIAVERAVSEAAIRKQDGGNAAATALERLRAGWDAYLALAREEPGVFRALAREVVAGSLPAAAQASYAALVENCRALDTEHPLRHAPETAAQLLWAAAHGAACLVLAGQHGFPVSPALDAALQEAAIAAIVGETRQPAPQRARRLRPAPPDGHAKGAA